MTDVMPAENYINSTEIFRRANKNGLRGFVSRFQFKINSVVYQQVESTFREK